MKNIVHIIARNVRKERLKQNLTQASLAEKAELHNNYVGLIERAECNISVVSLQKLANALNLEIKDLLIS